MSAATVLCDKCKVELIATRRGWVCPTGCSYYDAGRLYRDLPPAEECQP